MALKGLANKNILITGAAKRLGREIAIACAKEGANVLLHYHHSSTEAASLSVELNELGAKVWLFQADLSNPKACSSLFDWCLEESGSIDAIINNASIFPSDSLWDITEESIIDNMKIHALAPFHLAKSMHHANQRGNIINLLDARIYDYDSQHISYHLSKRMLADLTRILSVELAPNIRVNGIAPGLILPPEGQDESYLEKLAHTNPLKSFGNPEDITRTALFLLKSTFITGQIINVDGGRHMKGKFYG